MSVARLGRVDVHRLFPVHGVHPKGAVLLAKSLEGVHHARPVLGHDVEAEALVDRRVRHPPDAALQLKRLVGHDLGSRLQRKAGNKLE